MWCIAKSQQLIHFLEEYFLVLVLRIPGIHALSTLGTFKSWSKTLNEILSG